MKTLKLTHAESAAYAAGERRFWREVKPMPSQKEWLKPAMIHASPQPENDYDSPQDADYWQFFYPNELGCLNSPLTCIRCPYGTPGDRIELTMRDFPYSAVKTIAAITVTQRDGQWGWGVDVRP